MGSRHRTSDGRMRGRVGWAAEPKRGLGALPMCNLGAARAPHNPWIQDVYIPADGRFPVFTRWCHRAVAAALGWRVPWTPSVLSRAQQPARSAHPIRRPTAWRAVAWCRPWRTSARTLRSGWNRVGDDGALRPLGGGAVRGWSCRGGRVTRRLVACVPRCDLARRAAPSGDDRARPYGQGRIADPQGRAPGVRASHRASHGGHGSWLSLC